MMGYFKKINWMECGIKLTLFVMVLVVLVITLRGEVGNPVPADIKGKMDQATRPFELSPERGRFAHIYNLGENGQYQLNKEWAEVVYPDVGYIDGRFYGFFAPGMSYMAAPLYELGRNYNLSQVFTYAFVALCAALSAVIIYKLAHEMFGLGRRMSLVAPIIFLFGTTAWSYAITLYQHHLFALLLLGGFYSVWRFRAGGRFGWVWGSLVWLCYAIAIAIDYPNAVLMLPVMVYFLVSSFTYKMVDKDQASVGFRPAILATFTVFVLLSGLHAYHNSTEFGSWKSLSGTLVGYKDIKELNLLDVADEEPVGDSEQKEEIDIVSGSSSEDLEAAQPTIEELKAEKTISSFFSEDNIPFGFTILFFSPDRGMMVYAPIMLLGILGLLFFADRKTLEYWMLIAIVVVNVLLYSSWNDPWGGWAYGPRYMIPVMAILSLFAAVFIERMKPSWLGKIIALLLFAYSSAIALLGALTTNAVPPKVEGDYLGMKSNFMYNLEYLRANSSGSYVYDQYFANRMSLMEYGTFIWVGVMILVLILLFARRLNRKPSILVEPFK